ncbi:MAG: molybdopterin-dependent oxidoreductase [Acidobacteria bacterium]|nr:molybdopterin-dependent oxidoreductase [Acidobacteriota bacterium]
MDRRTFIKLTAITGTSATLASCGVPEHQIIRFVPDEELVPGVAEWKPSVCPLCSAGCGLNVRVMMADVDVTKDGQSGVVRKGVAKKLEGFPTHPISQGGLCARGQAAIQITYHPDRIVQPLKRTGGRTSGTFEPITWDQAIGEVVGKLDALAGADNTKALAILTGGRRSHRRLLFDQFAARFGAPAPIVYELFSDDLLRRANQLSFGAAQLPTFDLANANYVLAFGADFLGTWNAPVAQAAAFGQMRRGRVGVRGALVQVEARMTPTGATADEWVAAKPGTEGVLALGLAHVIMRDKLHPTDSGRAGALIDGWSAGLPDYNPDRVASITGVAARRVERLAHDFAQREPSVAIVGGVPLAHTNGLFTALAVNALNELVGAVSRKGGLSFTPQLVHAPAAARSSLAQFAAGVVPQVLVVDDVNPVFGAPRAMKVREALVKVPFIVAFGHVVDETNVLADLILPDHTFLESWVDALPESGSAQAVVSVAAPAMKPLFDTRATGDVLLQVASKLQKPIDLGATTYDAYVKAALAPLGDEAWSTAQKQAGWWGDLPKGAAAPSTGADAKPSPVTFVDPSFNGEAGEYPLQFLPYPSAAFYDGSLAHLPWLQELPDPMTSAMWSSWVELNPKTAERLGIGLGDVVEVTSMNGAVKAPAFLNPALSPDIVAMPVGQGHTNFTRYASGRGVNPIDILAPVTHEDTGTLAWAATRVKVARVSEPDGRLIMFSARGELRENPHEGETR